MTDRGKLKFFCGKMGAGKSTMSRAIAAESGAVLLSEDDWLAAHYPGMINSFDDYLKYSRLIRPFVKDLVQKMLCTGTMVVMDFPANTAKHRKWFLNLCQEVGSDHELIYLDVSDEKCLANISRRRSEQPERAQFDTEDVYREVTKYFEVPTRGEGINILYLA